MNSCLFSLSAARRTTAVIFAGITLAVSPRALSAQIQTAALTLPADLVAPSALTPKGDPTISSSASGAIDAPAPVLDAGTGGQAYAPARRMGHSIGAEVHIGINGAGLDLATAIARKWNIRIGGEYLQYTGNFTSDGAQITAALKVGGGKAGVDWFPFGNGFHISPQVRFAIQTDVNGTVIVPAGQSITLSGGDYISSATDPLTGAARITTRKVAPGMTIGWGNIVPRSNKRWSFPVEIGFYYIGQPHLNVTFKGTACDPTEPPAIGCEVVTQDPGFQHDLAAFIARNNNNLSYASFFPVAQFGVGYRF